jgi:alpha-tubulin suppressor-like RCC1 family protein
MSSSPHSVNPLGRAPRRPSSTRRAQFNAGPRKHLGIVHVSLVVLASFASRAAAVGTTVKSIVGAAYHTCAVMDDSSLMCWGKNDVGQLGVLRLPNTAVTSPVGPVDLGSGRTAKALSLGSSHTCAILDDNTLKCWGYGGYSSPLGYGDQTSRTAPEATAVVNLGAGRTAKAVSAGSSHTCAILDDDTLKCWGDNSQGYLGDGTTTMSRSPVATDLGLGRTAKAVSATTQHTCAILDDDTLKCWGNNGYGQLGDGTTTGRNTPTAVNLGSGRTAKAISAASSHTCAILDDDTLKCWGNGGQGQLGYGDATSRTAPEATAVVNLGAGRTAKAVSTGSSHTCALLDDDTLKCWGRGAFGMLGYGDETDRSAPEATAVVNLGTGRTAKAASAGSSYTCAILDDDTLKCWGRNENGKVGVGSSDELIWDPTEVKFDGSSSSGGSAGAPGPSGLNGTAGAPGPAGPKGDERTFTVAAAALIVAVIWPVVLVAYLVRQRNSSPRATKAVGAKPRLFDQPIDVESRL